MAGPPAYNPYNQAVYYGTPMMPMQMMAPYLPMEVPVNEGYAPMMGGGGGGPMMGGGGAMGGRGGGRKSNKGYNMGEEVCI
jgi:hypothetical protein